ncbi:hypothetical protein [Clostridium formicaceticum]|uniref:Uncharacterized protein n=1 Tax=Clostridium formicaceticum TaxID=1497 RepID=A0AAC9WGE2_9CLOT|nr:hypothetical protein [Clostridium formicaceticum]AOY77195.1 hypothetical protein BJL90_15870 [Clostridium formicaceticum]ARE87719.1 hypothetical protein CLFO_21190 [Clostridium formicaceticum]
MVTADERKQDIINTIEENPTEITIGVSTRKIVDGAWSIDDSSRTLTVRIFQQKNPEVSVISDTKGTADTSKKYGMLADHTADLTDLSEERIEFGSPYGKMEVLAIYPQVVKGEVCGYQCELKRVS